jgi:hypothetical protein
MGITSHNKLSSNEGNIIVAYRSIAKWWLCNSDRFWATARYTRSRGNQYARNNIVTVGDGAFLRGPCRDVISKRQSQLLGSSAREAVKLEPKRVKLEPKRVKLKNLQC